MTSNLLPLDPVMRAARAVAPLCLVPLFLLSAGCATSTASPAAGAALPAPTVRWLKPSEVVPSGQAPGAHHRLLATREDGSKDYVLILARGDEVWTGIADFARDENVTAARFTAIGAVQDPEVGWFDPAQHRYKAMHLAEQGEVISLVGDIGVGENGKPIVHSHLAFARSDGSAFGGHLIRATTSPTIELFVTTFPKTLGKKPDRETGLQLFDMSTPAP